MKKMQKMLALLTVLALILCLFAGCAGSTEKKDKNDDSADQANKASDKSDTTDDADAPANTCTLSISCASVLDHMEDLTEGKEELIPENGWMIEPTGVTFSEGEMVLDMLKRELQSRKMHFEVEGSGANAYVTGIGNLYQMDCGEMSGWTFYVNSEYPEIGFGSYELSDGDVVELIYVCSWDD